MTGNGKDWLFVSDAHFTGEKTEETEAFLRFLEAERRGLGHLVILGDLFEFLFGFKGPFHSSLFPPRHASFPFPEYLPVFNGLKRLFQEGIRIRYLEGNHDFFLRSFFQDWFHMSVDVYPERCEERFGERRCFMAHGDLSNPSQWRYRFYRRGMKNAVMHRLIQWIGPDMARRMAYRLSRESHRRYHASDPKQLSQVFRSFAHGKFLEGFDIVILGHSHVPEKMEEQVGGRQCLYLNVGDWMKHRSYVRFVAPDQFELKEFTGK